MTVTRLNSASASGGLSTSAAITITATTAGSTLVLLLGYFKSGVGGTQPNVTSIVPNSGTASFSIVPGTRYYDTNVNSADSSGGDVYIAQNVSGGITSITVTIDQNQLDSFACYELSPAVLDTAYAGGTFNSTTTGGSITCADAGAILLAATEVAGGFSAVNGPWTLGATVLSGNPTVYYSPGSATSSAPVFTSSDTFTQVGASFKDASPSSVFPLMGQVCL